MRLILVRHGATDWNQQRRVQGQSDHALSEAGRKEAEAAALALKEEKIEAIYSSPLKRAVETAQAINRFHQLAIKIEDGLKELNIGDLDGLMAEEIRSRYSSFWREWTSEELARAKFPGGESLNEAQQRAWGTIEEITRRHQHGVILAVGHYFVTMTIICKALAIDISYMRKFKPLGTGAMCILDFEDSGITLTRYNDTCHLAGEA